MGFSMKINMPIRLFSSLMKAFSEIPQRVVLQAFVHPDVKRMVGLPPNVLLFEKIPQQSLLAHEKTVLFITHCGTNSVIGEFFTNKKMLKILDNKFHFVHRGDLPQGTNDWNAHRL